MSAWLFAPPLASRHAVAICHGDALQINASVFQRVTGKDDGEKLTVQCWTNLPVIGQSRGSDVEWRAFDAVPSSSQTLETTANRGADIFTISLRLDLDAIQRQTREYALTWRCLRKGRSIEWLGTGANNITFTFNDYRCIQNEKRQLASSHAVNVLELLVEDSQAICKVADCEPIERGVVIERTK